MSRHHKQITMNDKLEKSYLQNTWQKINTLNIRRVLINKEKNSHLEKRANDMKNGQ